MEWWIPIIGFIGGMVAGVMNTLAGFGSIITLSILMELMGLPANVANGTNRLNTVFAGITATATFIRNDKLDVFRGRWYLIFTSIGAFIGIYLALVVSNEQFKLIFKFLIVVLFLILLLNPKRLLKEYTDEFELPLFILIPVFFLIGIYGGFIQMGMGVFFIVAIALLGRYNLVEGNALKSFIVLAYSIIALTIFWWNGLVDIKAGIAITLGQMLGAWISARFASRYKNANIWAYRILLIIVIFVIMYYFNIFYLLSNLF